jgi:flagellar biosynthesis/type III secretory pathway protein FliH
MTLLQKLQTIEDNVPKVYEAGYEAGKAEGGGSGGSYDKGYSDGYSKGYEVGYAEGETKGHTEGYNQGYDVGVVDGDSQGYTRGYNEGYAVGYAEGLAKGRTEGRAEGYNEGKTDGYAEGYEIGKADGVKPEVSGSFEVSENGDYTYTPESGKVFSNVSVSVNVPNTDGSYDEGYADGFEAGKAEGGNAEEAYEQGVADGKKAEYDAFWDDFQDNGNRTDYENAFYGMGWTAKSLRPKYPIKIVGAGTNVFRHCFFKMGIAAVVEERNKLLDISHISIDVSEATTCSQMFANARVTGATLIFSEKITSLTYAFNKGNGGEIAGMKITLLVPNPNCNWSNAFDYHRVQELNLLEGTVIGTNGFNVKWATALPHDSIVSIVNALSTTTSGLSITLSKTAVNSAFETSSGAKDGSTSAECTALVATRSNWTISLV